MRKDAAAGIGCCGTWEYMGPEAWCRLYGLPGLHSDTFAFGVILWEIYAAARPYTGLPGSPHLTMRKVRADDGQEHDDMTVVPAWYAKGELFRPLFPAPNGGAVVAGRGNEKGHPPTTRDAHERSLSTLASAWECPQGWELLSRACWAGSWQSRPSFNLVEQVLSQMLELWQKDEYWTPASNTDTHSAHSALVAAEVASLPGKTAVSAWLTAIGFKECSEVVQGWIQSDSRGLSELLSMHAFFGKLLAFFLAFRLNESVAAYQSGRQNIEDTLNALREMVTHLYCQGISQDAKSDPYHEYLRRELVRYVNLQFSLMRQALREANEGFTPGCGIVGKEFKDYWQLDPVEPRIANLVTKEEYLALKYIPPLARPTFIQTKINLLANKLSGYKELPGIFLLNFVRKHMKAMDAFESSIRIMETPVPMPYRHLILLFSFTYVYTYPWFAVTIKDAGGNSRIGHTDDADGLIGWVEAIVVRRFFCFGGCCWFR